MVEILQKEGDGKGEHKKWKRLLDASSSTRSSYITTQPHPSPPLCSPSRAALLPPPPALRAASFPVAFDDALLLLLLMLFRPTVEATAR